MKWPSLRRPKPCWFDMLWPRIEMLARANGVECVHDPDKGTVYMCHGDSKVGMRIEALEDFAAKEALGALGVHIRTMIWSAKNPPEEQPNGGSPCRGACDKDDGAV